MHLVSGQVFEQWNALSDEQIVVQVLSGQTAMFEVLMRRHNERIYRAARAIVRDDREAEDVMQEAYVNAYAHLRQFGGRAAFATWLTRIAVNEAIGRARRRGQYQQLDGENETAGDVFMDRHAAINPEHLAYAGEIRTLLEAAVDDLPDGAREVFMLRQIEGLSTAETAACLGTTEDVVKTRLSRARSALRTSLEARASLAASSTFTFQRPRCDGLVAAVLSRLSHSSCSFDRLME